MLIAMLLLLSGLFPASFHQVRENRIENTQSLSNFYELLQKSTRPVRIVHLGDSHVRGHVFTVTTRLRLEEAWGSQAVESQKIGYQTSALATETGKPGLVYHTWGINGARAEHFNNAASLQKVKDLNPDLIILSFGTNEAQGAYSEETHLANMSALVHALQTQCPTATVMLTTPPGSYRTQRVRHRKNGRTYYTYKRYPNSNTPRVATTQRKYAREHNLPLWDLYALVGGEQYALRNWSGAGMLRKDGVHFTDAGYKLMGNLLAEAMLKEREQQQHDK